MRSKPPGAGSTGGLRDCAQAHVPYGIKPCIARRPRDLCFAQQRLHTTAPTLVPHSFRPSALTFSPYQDVQGAGHVVLQLQAGIRLHCPLLAKPKQPGAGGCRGGGGDPGPWRARYGLLTPNPWPALSAAQGRPGPKRAPSCREGPILREHCFGGMRPFSKRALRTCLSTSSLCQRRCAWHNASCNDRSAQRGWLTWYMHTYRT